jgi:hypothetical protein
MARAPKTPMTWDTVFFATPEQKVLRYLLSSRDTAYTLRVLVSKLKGVRGLGGVQGLEKVLASLEEAGLVHFIDNGRSVRVSDEHPANEIMRRMWGLCELEALYTLLQPISSRGVLLGAGLGEIQLYVVTDQPEEVQKLTEQQPAGKMVNLTLQTRAQFDALAKKDPKLFASVNQGVNIWGASW